jgi:phosphoserine phosphatase
MIVTKNDNMVCFDVDETLVVVNYPPEFQDKVETFNAFGEDFHFVRHQKHIDLLRQFKARGHYVVVWSQGGWQWAEAVCKHLGIEECVDEVKTKPKWIVDDLPPNAFLDRVYMDLNGKRTKEDPRS